MNTSSWWNRYLFPLFFGVVSIAFLGFYYYWFRHFAYPSAPGGDLINHYAFLQSLKDQGVSVFFTGYPKFFHLLMYVAMEVTGKSFLRTALYLIPLVLLAVAFSLSWLAYLLKGRVAAVATSIFALIASGQPLQTVYDGGFPNTIAAHIFIPLTLGALSLALTTKRNLWKVLFLLFAFLTVGTHSFTAVVLAVILIGVPFYYPSFMKRYGILAILGVIAVILSPIGLPARSILRTFAVTMPSYPWVRIIGHLDNPAAIWRFVDYPVGIGQAVVYLGALGIVVLGYMAFLSKKREPLAYMILFWAVLLFVGSRWEAIGFPVRLARDLAAPLTVAAGVLIAWTFEQKAIWLRILAVAACVYLAYPMVSFRYEKVTTYDSTMQYSTANQGAIDYVGTASTASLDQPIAPLIDPQAHTVILHLDEEGDVVNMGDLAGFTYVVYENGNGRNGQIYRKSLDAAGYREVAAFFDPLKKVVVMQREAGR